MMDQEFFERCVYEAADASYYCENVEIFGLAVEVTFRSKSGKSNWNATLYFDENGDYQYWCGMPGASEPWALGNAIKNNIQSL
ncbi:MAG: hypothetical protein UIH32_09155 [Streptococcus mutans]|uniref:hypothetical protein n=2 Tax=Streptococcus mutans TaxID=1309 RepID=UPI0015D3BBBC|nr:hypothetical protein [Streptococcus mutans]MDB8630924.1 hypothetical protein [Streptococcus mutans]MDP5865206.1 hypothetical protein [Streptococcus mutans]MEE0813955.1 hypothetical protein [Streptococcus mutans]